MEDGGAKRLGARLANAFVLDLVKAGGHGRGVAAPLIHAAAMHTGVSWMMRDAALQRQYATLACDLPDELRRPAAVTAIAESIGIPFETVRRHVAEMMKQGACRASGKGFIVPAAVTGSPAHERGLALQYEALGRLHAGLRRLGVVEAPPTSPCGWPEPPLRLAGRFVVEFVLRFREQVSRHIRDPVSGVLLMEMVAVNTEQLTDDAQEGLTADGLIPNELRTPASTSTLVDRLGMANETVRRHILQLEAKGYCRRAHEGFIVPASVIASPPFQELVEANHLNLQRLFSQLAAFGVHDVFAEAA